MSARVWIKYDDAGSKETTDNYNTEDLISKLKPDKKYCVIKHDGKVKKSDDKIPVTTKRKPLHFISKISKSTILLLLP